MSVYVDDPIHPFRGMLMCHMLADSTDELHEFASKLGLKRSWFQPRVPGAHYDICKSIRAKAIKLGAIEVDRYQVMELLHPGWRERFKKPVDDELSEYL